MADRARKVEAFRDLHRSGCFVMPNVWDVGGARVMQALGFGAVATTSSGFAFTLGKRDGEREVTRDESLAHAAMLAAGTDIPVSADMEDGYAEDASGVAECVRLAAEAGLAGISIEDSHPTGPTGFRTYDAAVERIGAAVEAARRYDIVLTARADGMIGDVYDIEEAIRRLRAFEELGADVLYAPGLHSLEEMRRLCGSVSRPVNHLIGLGVSGLGQAQIAEAGVRRISLGGTLARSIAGDLVETGRAVAAGDFFRIEAAPSWGRIADPLGASDKS